MTTTGKQNLTYDPIDNNYYLKPPNDLTANLAGMFLEWSFTKCMFLCHSEIQYGHHGRR